MKAVPGFAAAAESEGWKAGLLEETYSPVAGGPQIAISPDGDTLFWKENREDSTQAEPGEVAIRGYSLSKGATSVVYGGHPYEEGKGICSIGTGFAPIAATGKKLVVYDHAFPPSGGGGDEEGGGSYGSPRVVTFGPGGSGCTAQAEAKLAIDGSFEEEATVQKSVDVVDFDGSESEIGGQIEKVEWDFGDGGPVEMVPGPEPDLSIDHRYFQAGTFTVELRIKLAGEGAPTAEASGTVNVTAAKPQAFLDVLGPSGFSVAAGGSVKFDASESWDPTGVPSGGECTQALGCPGSNEMAAYSWTFGDGSAPQTTAVPTVSHAFANPDSAPLARLVTLTVESVEGETDSDSRLVTVLGTSSGQPPEPGGPLLPPPPSPPPATGPVQGKSGGKDELLRKAIQRCRKLKRTRARRTCLHRARASIKHERRRGQS